MAGETPSWVQQQLTTLWSAVQDEATALHQNNGDAVDVQAVISTIQDPQDRATIQTSLDDWVQNQSKLAQGYNAFVSLFNQAWTQARDILAAAGLAPPPGLSGLGQLGQGWEEAAIVAAVAAVGVAALAAGIIHDVNVTQRQRLADIKNFAQSLQAKNATPQQVTDALTAYQQAIDGKFNQAPNLFQTIQGGVQLLLVVVAAVVLWPVIRGFLPRRLGGAAA